jgi:catechol 2,3-dioxygenase-like lactoylglutathione lyase family enzyme
MTSIQYPDHFTIVSDDLPATEAFYAGVLGFTVGPRPDFPVPGLWLYAKDTPILHVIGVDIMPEPRRGVLDHMAFRGKDINALLKRLDVARIKSAIVRTPLPWRQWQVFFRDPNGVDVEIDFEGDEALDAAFQPRVR